MRRVIIFLLVLFCDAVIGQNLVPNPDFESVNTVYCGIYLPSDFNASVNDWYAPTGGSPDLFSTVIDQSCWNFQPNSTYPGPIGIKGSQMPRSGNIMAGLFCYTIPNLNQREYIQTALTTPLVPGHYYRISFYASLADNIESSTNRLSAFFSTSAVTSGSDQPLLMTPQVSATSFITNVAEWTLISGIFQAAANYNYLTIGNFSNDANTSTQANPGGGNCVGCYGAYYFIDDVSVTETSVGIGEPDPEASVNIFFDPARQQLSIHNEAGKADNIIVYDLCGREIMKTSLSGKNEISTSTWPRGIYLYKLIRQSQNIMQEKFVIY